MKQGAKVSADIPEGATNVSEVGASVYFSCKIEAAPLGGTGISAKMPTYIPSDTPTAMKSSGYVRQNPWEKLADKFDSVKNSNKLHMPWGHTIDHVELFSRDPLAPFDSSLQGGSYRKVFYDFALDSVVLIPNGKSGLLVRIKSPVKAGKIETLCVACSDRTCGHRNKISSCDLCRQSVQEVFNPSDKEQIIGHLSKGHIIEPFYTLYRDVEIVGDADYNGVDWKTLASINAVGSRTKFWALK